MNGSVVITGSFLTSVKATVIAYGQKTSRSLIDVGIMWLTLENAGESERLFRCLWMI